MTFDSRRPLPPVLICVHFKGLDPPKKCTVCRTPYFGIHSKHTKNNPYESNPEAFANYQYQEIISRQKCTSCRIEFKNHELPTNLNEFCDLSIRCIICEWSLTNILKMIDEKNREKNVPPNEKQNFKKELAEYQRNFEDEIRDYEDGSNRVLMRCKQKMAQSENNFYRNKYKESNIQLPNILYESKYKTPNEESQWDLNWC